MVSYTVPAWTICFKQKTANDSVRSLESRRVLFRSTDTDTVTTSANLSITKTDGETAVTAGDGATHTYTITVSNAGPRSEERRVGKESRPGGSTQRSNKNSQGNCTTGPNFT